MSNERLTENIVRNLLKEKGYYDDENIVIEEQSSRNPKIDKLLKTASKCGNGCGKPEFIISFKNNSDDLVIIECKASIFNHESKDRKQYKDYAVDGTLLYASYLNKEFNVTAIAVSGENEKEKKISTFLWLKKHYTYKDIQDKIFLKSTEINKLIQEQSKPFAEEELIKKAIEYNSFLHNYSIPEVERCTLISAILIALQNDPFLNSYKYYTSNKELIDALLAACESILKQNDLDQEKRQVIISEYSKFKNNTDFNANTIYNKKTKNDEINTLLRDFISSINQDILPHINESQFDVLGKFYTQFIKYAGSDKKTGLVLTPPHITDFFCDISNIDENDIVFDPCCGTAGFLVSAMNYMLKKAGNDSAKQCKIKACQLIGIEKRADMFTHACSNMMMRGDGKSHILYGNCFDEKNREIIKKYKPTKGFLNPPYQDSNADEQLEFIENTLECLIKGGICIAICQMSTVVSDNNKVIEVRKRLLEKHSLKAVFSMPNDLFHPIGVNTCILVFKAHTNHSEAKETFFGYFKDDGFIKQKNNGRVDKDSKWKEIKESWLKAYYNKKGIAGLSIMKGVKAKDEWCAEAYMETDYSVLKKDDFIKNIKAYLSYKLTKENNNISIIPAPRIKDAEMNVLITSQWKYFKYDDEAIDSIFIIKKGKRLIKKDQNNGLIPYVSSSSLNNGIDNYIGNGATDENCLTFACYGSIGEVFYQDEKIWVSDNANAFYLRNKILNSYLAIFLITILRLEQFRFSYGMTGKKERLQKFSIKLPVDKNNKPDWEFMENYIKSLPYSGSL